jgi:hypothetical protein
MPGQHPEDFLYDALVFCLGAPSSGTFDFMCPRVQSEGGTLVVIDGDDLCPPHLTPYIADVPGICTAMRLARELCLRQTIYG